MRLRVRGRWARVRRIFGHERFRIVMTYWRQIPARDEAPEIYPGDRDTSRAHVIHILFGISDQSKPFKRVMCVRNGGRAEFCRQLCSKWQGLLWHTHYTGDEDICMCVIPWHFPCSSRWYSDSVYYDLPPLLPPRCLVSVLPADFCWRLMWFWR